jgi:hypothetical protein
MTIYTVLAPPDAGSAGPDRDRFVFIKEGFSWPAFFFTSIWLLIRRMWLVFLLYVLAAAAVVFVSAKISPVVIWPIVMLFGFLVALEANNLRRWTLERRGYRFIGVAIGHRLAEAEFRFFSTWPGVVEAATPVVPPKPAAPAILPPVATGEIVGLFPKPGGAS